MLRAGLTFVVLPAVALALAAAAGLIHINP